MEKHVLESLIVSEAKARGFKRKGNLFVREAGILKQLLYITRSRFQPLFLLDLGVVYDDVDYRPNTPMTWHLHCRADTLAALSLGRKVMDIEKSFDADSSVPLDERAATIRQVLDVAQREVWDRFPELDAVIRYCTQPAVPPIFYTGVIKKFAEAQQLS